MFLSLQIMSLLLKNRVLKPKATVASSRATVYKSWTEEKMQLAYNAVVHNGLSVRQAAEEYGVPRSTLGDRVSGRKMLGCKSGPPRILTDEQEECLVKFLIRCSIIGYSKSRGDVIHLIQEMCESKGIKHKVTDGWWSSFSKRHPNLTLRAASCLSKSRAVASDASAIHQYFEVLDETLETYGIKDYPNLIYNMDETGMPFKPKPPKGIFTRGERNPVMVTSGNKGQLTIVACTNATGYCIPPMVIIDRKNLSQTFCEGEVPGTIYGLSTSGWMNMELFHLWFSQHFLKYVPSCRPILLLIDGYKSHYNPETIQLAAKEQIILYTLPPNTTHLCQPLDRGCFAPLKTAWREACHQFMSENPGKVVSRYSFSRIFSIAWMKSMTGKNISASFKVTGIYPFNPHALLPDDDEESSHEFSYLPLLCPRRTSSISRNTSSFFNNDSEVSDEDGEVHVSVIDEDKEISDNEVSGTEASNKDVSADSVVSCDDTLHMLTHKCSLESILKPPLPIKKAQQLPSQTTSVRVLTSKENLKIMQQKEKEKRDLAQKKLEKKAERELKRRNRELAARKAKVKKADEGKY